MGRVASRLRGCLAVTALLLTCSGALAGQGARAAASPAERRAVEQATRLIEAGRATDASRALQDFLAREPISPTALALLVDLHGSEGDIAPVLPWLERAASRDASEPRIQRLWVSSLVRAGFGDSARTVARRWVQSAPSLAEAHLAVTDAALAGADTSTAIRVLAEARGSVEDERAVLERLADLYAASGDRSGLLESWEALLLLGEPGIVAMVEDARSGAWPRGVAGDLWDALLRRAPARSIRNGAHAALRLGAGEVARRLARAAEPGEGADRSRFLRSYVGEATDAGLPEEVAWAADELARLSTRPVDRQRRPGAHSKPCSTNPSPARRRIGWPAGACSLSLPRHRVTCRRLPDYGRRIEAPIPIPHSISRGWQPSCHEVGRARVHYERRSEAFRMPGRACRPQRRGP
jgi:hypothetical protein